MSKELAEEEGSVSFVNFICEGFLGVNFSMFIGLFVKVDSHIFMVIRLPAKALVRAS